MKKGINTKSKSDSLEMLSQIWSSSKILEYLVQSVRGRKRFETNNRILNLQEITPTDVEFCVQELLEAFYPQTKIRGLKVEVENNLIQPPEDTP